MDPSVDSRARELKAIAATDASLCCWLLFCFGHELSADHKSSDALTVLVDQAARLPHLPISSVLNRPRRLRKRLTRSAGKLNKRTIAQAVLAEHLSRTHRQPARGLTRLLAIATSGASWAELGGQLEIDAGKSRDPTPEGSGITAELIDTRKCFRMRLPQEFRAALDRLQASAGVGGRNRDDAEVKSATALAHSIQAIEEARIVLSDSDRPAKKRVRRAVKSARRAGKQARDHWRSDTSLPPELIARMVEIASKQQCGLTTNLETEKLESLAEFAAGAGHEINNPIAVISGRASLLARGESDPKRKRDLAVIKAQADRVYEMIAAMMYFARPPRPDIAEFDLAEAIKKLLAGIAEMAAARQIELATEGLWRSIPIQADAVQVAAALKAVYDNALFAIGQDGRVITSVAVDEATQTVRVIIRDTGPGISPEVRRHLFDPYFSGRQSGRGLGMGLSKAWRIIHQHAGTIEVQSNSGEDGYGATFVITLPMLAQIAD